MYTTYRYCECQQNMDLDFNNVSMKILLAPATTCSAMLFRQCLLCEQVTALAQVKWHLFIISILNFLILSLTSFQSDL